MTTCSAPSTNCTGGVVPCWTGEVKCLIFSQPSFLPSFLVLCVNKHQILFLCKLGPAKKFGRLVGRATNEGQLASRAVLRGYHGQLRLHSKDLIPKGINKAGQHYFTKYSANDGWNIAVISQQIREVSVSPERMMQQSSLVRY